MKENEVMGIFSGRSVVENNLEDNMEVVEAPVGSDDYANMLKEKYSETIDEIVILSDELYDSITRRDKIMDSIAKLKAEKEVIEQTIMALMKENEIAYVKNRKITWKKVQRTSFDAKTLKEEEPEIYNKYSKTSSIRIFKIK